MQQVIHYSVKLNQSKIGKRLFFTMLLTFVSFFLPVFATIRTDINKIKSDLSKGVNISFLEQYWLAPDLQFQTSLEPKLNEIAKAGFKTIRLPVAFDHFMPDNYAALDIGILKKLQMIYTTCDALHMKLIIVYHYGKLTNENIYTENDRIIRIWKQVIKSMQANSPENLFFELYNEPTTDMDVWKSSATTLVRELRKEDANRIFIIGGANFNGINELLHMGKIDVDDGKILYTFHFYEPYIFTHQGADWTPEKTFITGFPYPYNQRKMPRLYNAPSDSQLYKDYFRYPKEATYEYLYERIKAISKEAERINLPLICTETGVIKFADKKSRSAYLRDITNIMKEFNIPIILWDYDDKFSIKKGNKVICSLRPWLKD